jgi:hypothetical protein
MSQESRLCDSNHKAALRYIIAVHLFFDLLKNSVSWQHVIFLLFYGTTMNQIERMIGTFWRHNVHICREFWL